MLRCVAFCPCSSLTMIDCMALLWSLFLLVISIASLTLDSITLFGPVWIWILDGRWPPTQIALPSSSWPVREVWYLCVCLSVCVCVCVCVMLCCVSCFYSLLLVMGGIGFTMLEPFPPKPPGQWFVQPREGGRERRRLTRRTRTRKGTIGNDGLSRL